MNIKNRVLVIGLDGATFELIRPMVKEGKLPNLAKLMREGSFGLLRSTIPPITPCAWTSFATGKDPSKHGLYDFNIIEGNPENKKSANRTLVKAKSLWRILSEAGKKSIVIDVPLTYPPEEIDGIIISRIMAPPKRNCTHPKSLYYRLRKKGYIKKKVAKIAEEHGADKTNKKEKPKKLNKAGLKKLVKKQKNKAFKNIKEGISNNIKLTKLLINKYDWDFFTIVFMAADGAGHTFWDEQSKVKKIYENLDKAIGEIFRLTDENTTKFIMSDHGFTSIPYSFNINEWLYTKGFLFKKLDIPYKESMKALRAFLKKARKEGQKETSDNKEHRIEKFGYLIRADYSKSKAYLQSLTSYGVRINLEGRDSTGTVKEEDYETFRNYLIEEFKKIRHPVTGKKMFSQVLKKECIYSESPFGMDPAPDIFLLPLDMDVSVDGQFMQTIKIFEKTSKGYGFHHIDGIFFANGKDIKNLQLDSLKITDLAPTILHILGVPVPKDMDGRVLNEVFDESSDLAKRKIEYQAPSVIIGEQKEKTYSKRDEEDLKMRLKALGYVG